MNGNACKCYKSKNKDYCKNHFNYKMKSEKIIDVKKIDNSEEVFKKVVKLELSMKTFNEKFIIHQNKQQEYEKRQKILTNMQMMVWISLLFKMLYDDTVVHSVVCQIVADGNYYLKLYKTISIDMIKYIYSNISYKLNDYIKS